MRRRFYILSLSLLSLSIGHLCAESAPSPFDKVCEELRAVRQIETDFVEEKTLHILSHPLVSKGTLLFSPTQGVYRVTKEPIQQEMLITRTEMSQKDSQGAVQRMSVRRQPEARAFVDVFLSFFAGDSHVWEKTFETSFTGTVEDWQIDFIPKKKSPAAKALKQIRLKGHGGVLDGMTLEEAHGDVTQTTYTNQRVFLKTDAGDPPTAFPQALQGS